VANGFRGMPPWKDVYTPEELKQVVAWVMNRKFSP
jgi:mono/diheme cytochrome c family protein